MPPTAAAALVSAVALLAGAVASVTGFGVGSLVTPALAPLAGAQLAVALVAVPHFVATALRLVMLRRHVDRRMLLGFGVASAAGGLAGALLQAGATSRALALVFGLLLLLAGLTELTGWIAHVRWGRRAAWAAGALSGLLGGLVGNQGGIRAAALLGFEVPRHAFVATATAAGLIVDLARLPVYLATQGTAMLAWWPLVLGASLAAAAGTLAGVRVLGGIPERAFRRVVALVLIALGLWMMTSDAARREPARAAMILSTGGSQSCSWCASACT